MRCNPIRNSSSPICNLFCNQHVPLFIRVCINGQIIAIVVAKKNIQKAWSGRGRDWGSTVSSRKWRRLRAQRFYKLLTSSLLQISEWLRRVANTRLAIEGQRSGVMSELCPIQDSDSENA